MSSLPAVSILTLTYNHERFIGDALSSALAQTFASWEMIVLDDGSTDSTVDRVRSVRDERIRLLRRPHLGPQGLAEHYNRALSSSRGEFIALLEGDDYWPPGKLEAQVPRLRSRDSVLSFGLTQVVDEAGRNLSRIPNSRCARRRSAMTNSPPGSALTLLLDPRILTFLFPPSVLIRKRALQDAGGFRQPPYLPLVDHPTFVSLAWMGTFDYQPRVLGYWRRHAGSITSARLHDVILPGILRYWLENRPALDLPARDEAKLLRSWRRQIGWLYRTAADWENRAGDSAQARRWIREARGYGGSTLLSILAESVPVILAPLNALISRGRGRPPARVLRPAIDAAVRGARRIRDLLESRNLRG